MISDRNIEPNNLANYISSKGILDKKTISKALETFKENQKNNPEISFSQVLVDNRFMLATSIEKILDDIEGKSLQTEEKVYDTDTEIAPDVDQLRDEIEDKLKGKEEQLNELLEMNKDDVQNLLSEEGISWEGRKMSKQDKADFIKKMATIKAKKEVSKTNGVFVLSWMDEILEST